MTHFKTYICENCFHIQKRFRKLKCEECKGNTFYCDEWIAPTISLLNKKGYFTEYCCSGHPVLYLNRNRYSNSNFGTYIMFKDKCPKPLPKYFFVEECGSESFSRSIYWGKSNIEKTLLYKSHGERLIALAKVLDTLHSWAEKLPIKTALKVD